MESWDSIQVDSKGSLSQAHMHQWQQEVKKNRKPHSRWRNSGERKKSEGTFPFVDVGMPGGLFVTIQQHLRNPIEESHRKSPEAVKSRHGMEWNGGTQRYVTMSTDPGLVEHAGILLWATVAAQACTIRIAKGLLHFSFWKTLGIKGIKESPLPPKGVEFHALFEQKVLHFEMNLIVNTSTSRWPPQEENRIQVSCVKFSLVYQGSPPLLSISAVLLWIPEYGLPMGRYG